MVFQVSHTKFFVQKKNQQLPPMDLIYYYQFMQNESMRPSEIKACTLLLYIKAIFFSIPKKQKMHYNDSTHMFFDKNIHKTLFCFNRSISIYQKLCIDTIISW